MTNPLALQSVLQLMADALPTHPKNDTTSDLSTTYEVVSLLSHACMTALKFRLIGFDEEKPTEDELSALAPRLPPSWNSGFGSIRFVYAHKQSSMTFILRVSRVGGKVEISGMAQGHDVIHRFEITAKDTVNSSKLPLRITLSEDGSEDRIDLPGKLKDVFLSLAPITSFIESFQKNILQKLIPKLQMDGYVESPDDRDALESVQQQGRAQAGREPGRPFPSQVPQPGPSPFYPPHAQPPQPRVPVGDFPPPRFEDEHEINGPARPFGLPGRSPFNIGHDDLNPPGLGPHDPLRPSFVGGGGLSRPGGGGGMHPTFDDPLFFGQGEQGGQGAGIDPQAPPGARWDPVAPGGFPRQGGGRGNPFGGRGGYGGGFGGGFGGDII